MKKVDFSNAIYPEKQPVTEQTLDFFQQSWREMGAAIILGMLNGTYTANSYVILYGCVNSGSGLNYIISAGAVYCNGVYYEVPAQTFTANIGEIAVGTLTVTQDSVDPIKMQPSGTAVSVHNITKLIFATGSTGSADVDFPDLITLGVTAEEINLATQTTSSTGYVNCTGLSYTTTKAAKYEVEFIGTCNPSIGPNNNGTPIEGGGRFQIWNDTDSAELSEIVHYVWFKADTTTGDMGAYDITSVGGFAGKTIVSLAAGKTIKCRFQMVTGGVDVTVEKAKMIIKEVGRL